MNRILSTKILPPNLRQMLLNAGLSFLESDFIQISTSNFKLAETHELLIFTSQNAVESVLKHRESQLLREKKVMCVGTKTKLLLEKNKFEVIECEDYAEKLVTIITSNYSDKTFSFFSGNLRRDTLPEALKSAGIVLHETQVYETILSPRQIKATLNGILFFSPSGVTSFLKQNKITDETCFCIGNTTADALAGITNNIIIANRPTVENTVVQCINYFKTRQNHD